MGDSVEDLEPLFDYRRVQPANFFYVDDEELDSSPILPRGKKKRKNEDVEKKKKNVGDVVLVLDDDEDKKGKEDEEDWMPPPPPKIQSAGSGFSDDNTIRELRLKKQELASLAQSAEDFMRSVTAPTKTDPNSLEKATVELKGEQPLKRVDREKIIISVQDKDGQKQFRVYTDDKFEKLFKMYSKKVKLGLETLVFLFDGDKVSPTATPKGLGLENDDMIEVHIKSK